jgi:hypothetical protein
MIATVGPGNLSVARLDPALSARVVASRSLRYDLPPAREDDRPPHVRAASGLAFVGGRLVVIQDDASFFAIVTPTGATAIPLPRGPGGRRRFEVVLGNKRDKLDLESAIAIDDELWAFGSGSTAMRERIARWRDGAPVLVDAAPLYANARVALGGYLNVEGVARVSAELWWFHRGNTGPADAGPAVVRLAFDTVRAWLDGGAPRSSVPPVLAVDRYDLGAIAGQRLGFTDAVAHADRVFYLAAAEASPDAIADGAALGSQLGVIAGATVRAAALVAPDGTPIKAEGLALDPDRPGRAFVTIDPDDPEIPTTIYEIELLGPW